MLSSIVFHAKHQIHSLKTDRDMINVTDVKKQVKVL